MKSTLLAGDLNATDVRAGRRRRTGAVDAAAAGGVVDDRFGGGTIASEHRHGRVELGGVLARVERLLRRSGRGVVQLLVRTPSPSKLIAPLTVEVFPPVLSDARLQQQQ